MARQYRQLRMELIGKHLGQLAKLLDSPDWSLENLDKLCKWSAHFYERCSKARADALEKFKEQEGKKDVKEEPSSVPA